MIGKLFQKFTQWRSNENLTLKVPFTALVGDGNSSPQTWRYEVELEINEGFGFSSVFIRASSVEEAMEIATYSYLDRPYRYAHPNGFYRLGKVTGIKIKEGTANEDN